jgi:hypothetical protein
MPKKPQPLRYPNALLYADPIAILKDRAPAWCNALLEILPSVPKRGDRLILGTIAAAIRDVCARLVRTPEKPPAPSWRKAAPDQEGIWARKAADTSKDMAKWRVFYVEKDAKSDTGWIYVENQTFTTKPRGGWWILLTPKA